ncbi:hypothetical protein BDK51DRAFT_43207 [Blyttiomyces helicus]|uniref:Uncharacterized protein n=1 Tax=Blyttiomyces helicus TaxID=388810 RepID=A0A4P9W9H4_9FUNG|nr:hypothetical protein BDK51DRAFT_43207 [Blyttiomyces helicus]|eukprot:RKO88165.1 hypothetical protein BDK51DRAFT_43207 [Blyttiomyces helicus]
MSPHPVTPLKVDTKSKFTSHTATVVPYPLQPKAGQDFTGPVVKKKIPIVLDVLGVIFFLIGITVCAVRSRKERKAKRLARRLALRKKAKTLNILVSPLMEDIELDEYNLLATPTMLPPVDPDDFSIVTILTLPPETDKSQLMVNWRPPTPVRRRISSVTPTVGDRSSPTPSSTSSRSSTDLIGSVNIIIDDGRKGRGDGRKGSGGRVMSPDSPLMLAVPSLNIEGPLPTAARRTPSIESV